MLSTYTDFKRDFYTLSGLNLNLYTEAQMKRRIDTFMLKSGYRDYGEFIKRMKQDNTLFHSFLSYLTINVSSFFRNPDQWNIFSEKIVPELKKSRDKIRIWSAACATGEEPYTINMIMSNAMLQNRFEILATDIDSDALQKAKEGVYKEKDIVAIPYEYREKYVASVGDKYIISNKLKGNVRFSQHNLLKDNYPLRYDFICCRNVIIYFTNEARDMVHQRLIQSLKKGGILFVGNTEQVKKENLSELEMIDTFFYRKV